MPANLLLPNDPATVPETPQPATAVAGNFEQFDGLAPLDNEPGQPPVEGSPSSPGGNPTPSVFTHGPLAGLTNTLGGMPLPVENPLWKFNGKAQYVYLNYRQFPAYSTGQNYQGVAQTVALNEITANPPQPGDLQSILAGWG